SQFGGPRIYGHGSESFSRETDHSGGRGGSDAPGSARRGWSQRDVLGRAGGASLVANERSGHDGQNRDHYRRKPRTWAQYGAASGSARRRRGVYVSFETCGGSEPDPRDRNDGPARGGLSAGHGESRAVRRFRAGNLGVAEVV